MQTLISCYRNGKMLFSRPTPNLTKFEGFPCLYQYIIKITSVKSSRKFINIRRQCQINILMYNMLWFMHNNIALSYVQKCHFRGCKPFFTDKMHVHATLERSSNICKRNASLLDNVRFCNRKSFKKISVGFLNWTEHCQLDWMKTDLN